jgi:hypothetical protein
MKVPGRQFHRWKSRGVKSIDESAGKSNPQMKAPGSQNHRWKRRGVDSTDGGAGESKPQMKVPGSRFDRWRCLGVKTTDGGAGESKQQMESKSAGELYRLPILSQWLEVKGRAIVWYLSGLFLMLNSYSVLLFRDRKFLDLSRSEYPLSWFTVLISNTFLNILLVFIRREGCIKLSKVILPRLKPKTDYFYSANVVYKFDCPCLSAYIGETSKLLELRIFKHRTDKQSHILQHINHCEKFKKSLITSYGDQPNDSGCREHLKHFSP